MRVNTEPSQERLEKTARREHANCLMCGRGHASGIRLQFRVQPEGTVVADYLPDQVRQGYPGLLHGGTIAALLDAAMTNALFARGITALTARLNVRYRHPVRLGVPLTVGGWLVDASLPLCNVAAEVRQAGRRVAQASAVFMQAPNENESPEK